MKTQTLALRSLAVLVTLTSLGQLAQAADPAPSSPVANSTVKYDDLRVDSAQGADRLYHRIAAAAQQVCGGHEHLRAVADQARVGVCVEQSIKRAVAAVNQPALTALLASKTGQRAPQTVLANRR